MKNLLGKYKNTIVLNPETTEEEFMSIMNFIHNLTSAIKKPPYKNGDVEIRYEYTDDYHVPCLLDFEKDLGELFGDLHFIFRANEITISVGDAQHVYDDDTYKCLVITPNKNVNLIFEHDKETGSIRIVPVRSGV